jgi:hypothetical protein
MFVEISVTEREIKSLDTSEIFNPVHQSKSQLLSRD